jgi:hypothetical protein
VQDDPAHELHVEHPLVGRALTGFADGCERLEHQVVEALSVLEPLPEVGGLALKVGGGELLELGLEGGDVRRLLLKPLDAAALADAEHLFEIPDLHGSSVARGLKGFCDAADPSWR